MTSELVSSGDATLVDLLDRLLAGGVVLVGDVSLSLADIELVRIKLSAVITSVPTSSSAGRG